MESTPRPRVWTSFLRSQIASIAATAVDFGLLILLVERFSVWYVLATSLGALAGAVVNFTINRFWSFQATRRQWEKQAWRYALVSTGSLILNTLGVWGLTEATAWAYSTSKIIVALTVGFAYNFPLFRWWVFRR